MTNKKLQFEKTKQMNDLEYMTNELYGRYLMLKFAFIELEKSINYWKEKNIK